MKLTKAKLQQIIKEELQKVSEADYLPPPGSEFDLEKYPITPQEKASDEIAQRLDDVWIVEQAKGTEYEAFVPKQIREYQGWAQNKLATVDDQILDLAIAVRDGELDEEAALAQLVGLSENKESIKET